MANCDDCVYYSALVEGDLGYDPDEARGYCLMCPPRPTGEYRVELAQWTIVAADHLMCGMCMCRGCASKPPPITYFILQENGDKILQENGDGILIEY
ncbi:hypothetical protein KKE60_08575 [Patescibacteria group bacterium]|nr:hypothetical protein [Patescibacteria group bacterium]